MPLFFPTDTNLLKGLKRKGGDKGEILYNRKSAMAYLVDNHSTLLHQIGS